jgi:hypothetical protein
MAAYAIHLAEIIWMQLSIKGLALESTSSPTHIYNGPVGVFISFGPRGFPLNAETMYCEARSCHLVSMLLYETWPGPDPDFGQAWTNGLAEDCVIRHGRHLRNRLVRSSPRNSEFNEPSIATLATEEYLRECFSPMVLVQHCHHQLQTARQRRLSLPTLQIASRRPW